MRREDTFFTHSQILNLRGNPVKIERPLVMGIVNLTPDSFHAPSRDSSLVGAIKLIEKQLSEGADWIDLGAISTRPDAPFVDLKTELDRLIPVLKEAVRIYPEAIISIDTFRAEVAQAAVNEGAAIINDVYAGHGDPEMFDKIAQLKVPYIAMHSRGNSLTMQSMTDYKKLPDEIIQWSHSTIQELRIRGVADIIVDPGIGFAKTIEQNFEIINKLEEFGQVKRPVLIGISRKRFIRTTFGDSEENVLKATSELHLQCLQKGGKILRVHDVAEAVELVRLYSEQTNN